MGIVLFVALFLCGTRYASKFLFIFNKKNIYFIFEYYEIMEI